jgi:hypothetical protein
MNITYKSIEFDKLSCADTISVQTVKSTYEFSLLDPSNRKGLLSGGSLGNHAIEAFLSGTVSPDSRDFDMAELKTGARAIFFVESKKSVRRLITSVITDLSVARNPVSRTSIV